MPATGDGVSWAGAAARRHGTGGWGAVGVATGGSAGTEAAREAPPRESTRDRPRSLRAGGRRLVGPADRRKVRDGPDGRGLRPIVGRGRLDGGLAGHRDSLRRKVGRRRQGLLDHGRRDRARQLLGEDREPRRPALAVALLERLVDADLGGRGGDDFLSGDEEELVEDAEVRGIPEDDADESFADFHRNGGVPDRELRRKRRDDRGRQRAECFPGNVFAAVLFGEGTADVVFGDGASFEQKGTDPAARKSLNGQRPVHVLFAHGAGSNQQDTQSRHSLSDYRVTRRRKEPFGSRPAFSLRGQHNARAGASERGERVIVNR